MFIKLTEWGCLRMFLIPMEPQGKSRGKRKDSSGNCWFSHEIGYRWAPVFILPLINPFMNLEWISSMLKKSLFLRNSSSLITSCTKCNRPTIVWIPQTQEDPRKGPTSFYLTDTSLIMSYPFWMFLKSSTVQAVFLLHTSRHFPTDSTLMQRGRLALKQTSGYTRSARFAGHGMSLVKWSFICRCPGCPRIIVMIIVINNDNSDNDYHPVTDDDNPQHMEWDMMVPTNQLTLSTFVIDIFQIQAEKTIQALKEMINDKQVPFICAHFDHHIRCLEVTWEFMAVSVLWDFNWNMCGLIELDFLWGISQGVW